MNPLLKIGILALLALREMPAQAMPREEFAAKLASAIESSFSYDVALDDMLGEGEGHWDKDPRYPDRRVNCMIWLQTVLARAYASTRVDEFQILDRLRYYGGQPAFSLRKHYVDHWLEVEPAPLKPIPLQSCAFPYFERVELAPERFVAAKGFGCPLYKMSQKAFDVQYVTRDGLTRCSSRLAPGFYVAFAVPSARYARQYLGASGPMGLVHSLIFKLERDPAASVVYHASTAARRVLREPLTAYLAHMKNLHRGYSVYELDPDWHPLPIPPPTPEMRALMECESRHSR